MNVKGCRVRCKSAGGERCGKKWDEYMKDILIMEKDPVTGAQPLLTQVFSFR